MELLISHRRQWFQQKQLVLFVAAAFFSYRAMAPETTGGGLAPSESRPNESIAEIDYGLQLTRWLKIRPNLQYVINPGGTGKIPNAFVIGLYTEVTF
jgi:carbohydrate-selective porin OprB